MKTDIIEVECTDGVKLYGHRWSVDEGVPVKGILCFVHGIGEHSARYSEFASILTHYSIDCYGFDQRGHGNSPGIRAAIPSYDQCMNDIQSLLELAQKTSTSNTELPLFLLGHSMGGNLVTNYALRRASLAIGPRLKGAIVASPWLILPPDVDPPKVVYYGAKLAKFIVPNHGQDSKLDPSLMSRDPEQVKKYIEDPLIHSRVTFQLFVSAYDAAAWALEHAGDLKVPMYLYHGSDDKVCYVEGSKQFAAKQKSDSDSQDFTFKVWEGGYHELHHDICREEVMNAVADWITKRL